MQTSNEIRVGIMFLTGLILLVLVILTITRWGETRKTYTFTIRYPQAQGLLVGASVRVSGVEMGRVKEINLDRNTNQPLVTVQVYRSLVLHRNDTFSIGMDGLVGARFVDIYPNPQREGKVVTPGSRVEGSVRADMETIIANANVLVGKLNTTADSLNSLVGDPENQRNLRQTMANLNRASTSAAQFTTALNSVLARNQQSFDLVVADLGKSASSASAFTATLNAMLERNQRQVDETIAGIRSSSVSAAEFTATLNDVLQRNQQAMDLIIGNLGKTSSSAAEFSAAMNTSLQRNQQAIDLIVANMQSVTTDLRKLSETITPRLSNTKMLDNLETATQRVATITERLQNIADAVSTLLNDKELSTSIRASVGNLKKASGDLAEMMEEARLAAAPFPEMTQNLRDATQDLHQITQPFKEVAPETAQNLLRISRSLRTTSDTVSDATHQIINLGNVLRSISFETQARMMALTGSDRNSRSDFNLDITGGDNYFRIGLTDVGGANRINAQSGNRLGDLGLFRYGLVQSRFGVGLDLRERARWGFSAEIFDPDSPRANALFDFHMPPMGNDWWLSAGWYDLLKRDQTSFGLGLQYRPK